jgi:hypothetical protein
LMPSCRAVAEAMPPLPITRTNVASNSDVKLQLRGTAGRLPGNAGYSE